MFECVVFSSFFFCFFSVFFFFLFGSVEAKVVANYKALSSINRLSRKQPNVFTSCWHCDFAVHWFSLTLWIHRFESMGSTHTMIFCSSVNLITDGLPPLRDAAGKKSTPKVSELIKSFESGISKENTWIIFFFHCKWRQYLSLENFMAQEIRYYKGV